MKKEADQRPVMLAVGGDSGSGKSTLTDGIVKVFGADRVTDICLDDYHLLDRTGRKKAGITALHPDANNFMLMYEQLKQLAAGKTILKPVYDHSNGTFAEPEEITPKEIVIVHGLHPLFTEELRHNFHVTTFLDPEVELKHNWKIKRDTTQRGYTVEQVQAEIEARKPDVAAFVQPQKQYADIIIRFYRGEQFSKSDDNAHLNVRIFESKRIPKLVLSNILEPTTPDYTPALRLIEDGYEGEVRDILEIDGHVTREKAEELEEKIWSHLESSRHMRPDRLGWFLDGAIQRHSDPLGMTQLITLYHVLTARESMHKLSTSVGSGTATD